MPAPLAQPGLRDVPVRLDWRGPVALFALAATLAAVRFDLAYAEWQSMFSGDGAHVDWLLVGLGVFFLFCAVYDVNVRLDLATLATGFLGGTIIEIWGTRTGLWHYYTFERPPLWILPAWSMSALANERLLRLALSRLRDHPRELVIADPSGTPAWRFTHRLVFGTLFAAFLWWSRPALFEPYTWIMTALFVAAFRRAQFPRYALGLLACGVSLGVFLEIWGTTRHCWNYYDGKAPSPFPIFAHGLAGVCFWRFKETVRAALARRGSRRPRENP
jgi:hypothetical protein